MSSNSKVITEVTTEMPRSRSIFIQSERVLRRSPLALTWPARLMAPPNSSSFSVSVVLPASGWEMIANVRRRATSSESGERTVESAVTATSVMAASVWQGKGRQSRLIAAPFHIGTGPPDRKPEAPQKRIYRSRLQRALEQMRDLADQAAAEQQPAGDEDHPLDHRHPLAEAGQILLHGDDHESTDHRAEHRAQAADQRHQHDFARHAPVHVGERGVLRHEHFQRAGKACDGAGQDEGEHLVLVGLIAQRDRALLVLADGFQHLAERRIDDAEDQEEAGEKADQ